MSLAYVRAVEASRALKPGPWAVLRAIAWWAYDNGRYQCSLTDLAAEVGLRPETVSRITTRLAAAGWLEVTRTGGHNIYDLSTGRLSDLAKRQIEKQQNVKSRRENVKSHYLSTTTTQRAEPSVAACPAVDNRGVYRDERGYVFVTDEQLTMEV